MKMTKVKKVLSIFLLSTLLSSCNSNPSVDSSINNVISYKLETNHLPKEEYDQYETLSLTGLVVSKVRYINDIKVSSTILDESRFTLTYQDNNDSVINGSILKNVGDYTVIVKENNSSLTTSFDFTVNPIYDLKQSVSFNYSNLKTEYNIAENFDYQDITGIYSYSYIKKNGNKKELNKNLTYQDIDMTINNQNAKVYAFDKEAENIEVTLSYTCLNGEVFSEKINVSSKDEYQYDSKVMNVTISNHNKEESTIDKGYYSPDEVETNSVSDYANHSYEKWKYTPSTGNVNLLVIPLVLPNDSVTDEEVSNNLSLINQAFKGDDCTFASLKSYYLKSSYNLLNFNPIISSFLNVKEDLTTYPNYSSYENINSRSSSDSITKLVKDASLWAINDVNMPSSDFDSNNDGCIDGIWVIYMGHKQDSSTELYWAFTTSTGEVGTTSNPVTNIYGWCGMDFLTSDSNQNVDTHTIIHETGHMLGLNDYYSYSYSGYSPLGTIDMMDHNVGDQNTYSKLILGWIKPYIVYGNNVNISLKSSQFKDCIIIFASDDKEYKKDSLTNKIIFNVFDEYLILDYYTPTNLNLPVKYEVYDSSTINSSGGRLYHVDARLAYLNGTSFKLFDDPDDFLTSNKTVFRAITNSEQGNRSEQNYGLINSNYFDEIRWISADKKYLNDYELISQFPFPSKKVESHASSSSLFKENDTFSLSSYSKQFNSSTLNNKKTCSYSFKINSIA